VDVVATLGKVVVQLFEVVYGQPPSTHIPYLAGDSKVEAIDRSLKGCEDCINMLKYHLSKAQVTMKQQPDKQRTEKTFEVGIWYMSSCNLVDNRLWLA